ncbi:hypothetical protein TWF696_003363 [Orbilia brochopaga]|uniref:Uncharacterized protein n=1 Tax=Orbilia brochopaga TaxID=3140254 RepID=A0AAV9TXK5_9PEZI
MADLTRAQQLALRLAQVALDAGSPPPQPQDVFTFANLPGINDAALSTDTISDIHALRIAEARRAEAQHYAETHAYGFAEHNPAHLLAVQQAELARAQEHHARQVAQLHYGMVPGAVIPTSMIPPFALPPSDQSMFPGTHPPNIPFNVAQYPPSSPTIATENTPFMLPSRVWPSEGLKPGPERHKQQLDALQNINKRIDDELDRSPAMETHESNDQISWEQMEHHMRVAYIQGLDKGVMDCLLRQDPGKFIFFDIKYTHVGDYLEIGFARTPAQICLMNIEGEIIYHANVAMFDPRSGKEILCMIDWLQLVNEYLITGAMSRRWYDVERVKAAIEVMRGYFGSRDVRRLSIQRIRQDLDKLDYRNRILFTHDPSLRTYDLLRKLLLTSTLPPRLLTLSSHKMVKMLLPDMPTNLYHFYVQLIDHESFGTHGKSILKNIATGDAGYIRQIFRFFMACWDVFQKSKAGRPRTEAAERLVDIWDSIPPDSPVFDPASDSDNDDDQGLTTEQVDAYDREGMAGLEAMRTLQHRSGHRRTVTVADKATQTVTHAISRKPFEKPIMTENPAAGVEEYRGERMKRRPVTPTSIRLKNEDFSFRT